MKALANIAQIKLVILGMCCVCALEPWRPDTDEQLLTGTSNPSCPLHRVASPIMGT